MSNRINLKMMLYLATSNVENGHLIWGLKRKYFTMDRQITSKQSTMSFSIGIFLFVHIIKYKSSIASAYCQSLLKRFYRKSH